MSRPLLRVVPFVVLVLAACSGGRATAPTTTVVSSNGTETTVAAVLPDALDDVDQRFIAIDGRDLLVAVAATPEERARGLMEVTDLGDLDGMLFVLDEPGITRFWMKNTLIPLDIAFFDDAERFVAAFVMEPCTADPCPTYGPDVAVRYALEMPAGTLPPLEVGSVLDPGG